jgi:hypothetical protein
MDHYGLTHSNHYSDADNPGRSLQIGQWKEAQSESKPAG